MLHIIGSVYICTIYADVFDCTAEAALLTWQGLDFNFITGLAIIIVSLEAIALQMKEQAHK